MTIALSDLDAFVCIARFGSFKRAASERGVSVSLLSQTIRRLEQQLGVSLFNRTTRSLALTEAGEDLLSNVTPAFSQIGHAIDHVNRFRDTALGLLRINAPAPIAHFVLAPLGARFLGENPNMALEIVSDAAFVDIVQAGFDAGVRFGEDLAQDMVAIPIGQAQRYAVVASPGYLAGRAVPRTVDQLDPQACVRQRFPGGKIFQWDFKCGSETRQLAPRGAMTVTDALSAVHAACHGAGFAYVHEDYVTGAIADGALVRVLADWSPGIDQPYLYYPRQRHMPASLRAFVDFVKAQRD
ncbi:MAG: LysR family transcriptional regulator [Pseudomonadota bacterium]